MFDKQKIFERDNYTCQRCGCTDHSKLSIAHRIKQGEGTLNYIKKTLTRRNIFFADKVIIEKIINSPLNVVTACQQGCNDFYNIFNKPVERDKLLDDILKDIMIKYFE
jgi:hypothetical protein